MSDDDLIQRYVNLREEQELLEQRLDQIDRELVDLEHRLPGWYVYDSDLKDAGRHVHW